MTTETKGYDPAQGSCPGCAGRNREVGRGNAANAQQTATVRLGALAWVEQSPVLENCVAIGHPSDVIRHGTSTAAGSVDTLGAYRMIPMFRRHETYVLE